MDKSTFTGKLWLTGHSYMHSWIKLLGILCTQVGLQQAVEYTVVIEDGVGSIVRERVGACSSTQCSHTYYPAVGSRVEFGVSVETAGCVTRQTVCQERPVCE